MNSPPPNSGAVNCNSSGTAAEASPSLVTTVVSPAANTDVVTASATVTLLGLEAGASPASGTVEVGHLHYSPRLQRSPLRLHIIVKSLQFLGKLPHLLRVNDSLGHGRGGFGAQRRKADARKLPIPRPGCNPGLQGNRIKMTRRSEAKTDGSWRKAPAAGSTPDFQSKQRFAFGFCPCALGVGS